MNLVKKVERKPFEKVPKPRSKNALKNRFLYTAGLSSGSLPDCPAGQKSGAKSLLATCKMHRRTVKTEALFTSTGNFFAPPDGKIPSGGTAGR